MSFLTFFLCAFAPLRDKNVCCVTLRVVPKSLTPAMPWSIRAGLEPRQYTNGSQTIS